MVETYLTITSSAWRRWVAARRSESEQDEEPLPLEEDNHLA